MGIGSLPVRLGVERAGARRLPRSWRCRRSVVIARCCSPGAGRSTPLAVVAAPDRPAAADGAPAAQPARARRPGTTRTGVTLYVLGMLVERLRAAASARLAMTACRARLARHRPARPGADRARRDRRADHLDPEPRDGGRARPAGDAAGRAGRAALRRADAAAAPRATARTSAGARTPWIVGGMAVLALGRRRRRRSRRPGWRSHLAGRHRARGRWPSC